MSAGPDYRTSTVGDAALLAALDLDPEPYWPPEAAWEPPGDLDDHDPPCGCADPGYPCEGRKRGGSP